MIHIPVLQKEVLQYLDLKPNKNFIDCTIGEGGHTASILDKNKPNGKVLGIEIDLELYQKLKLQDLSRLILVNDSYTNLKKIVANLRLVSRREKKNSFGPISGILFDLGMSSWHLEDSGRGFSFMRNEPLDMRYNPRVNSLTAEEIVNNYSQEEIEKILKEYGEERLSKRIAKRIVKERPIKTTFQLVEIIKKVTPRRTKIHPATRTFQALRIAVNDELNNLRKVLPQAIEILAPEGRIVVISFHSLEDRIVKRFFKGEKNIKIITKKPITANEEEIKINPRSRSAKLRAVVKIHE